MEITGLATQITGPLTKLGTEASIVSAAAITLGLALWGLSYLVGKGKKMAR